MNRIALCSKEVSDGKFKIRATGGSVGAWVLTIQRLSITFEQVRKV